MLFAIGTKVKFLHTGDEGVVKKMLKEGMVMVYIEAMDMEIPAFVDDLIQADDFYKKQTKAKAKVVQGKIEKDLKPKRMPAATQYTILKSYGIQLAFDPILKQDGTTEKYLYYLINDTRYDVIFEMTLFLDGEEVKQWSDKLESVSTYPLGTFFFDHLNDHPNFQIQAWQITTAGKGDEQSKTLKIKPKQFFKNVLTAPLLNKRMHVFKIFENLSEPEDKGKEDLKTYAKRNSKPAKYQDPNLRKFQTHNSKEFSEFSAEIDLHIEKLVEKTHKMTNAEILKIQLDHFDKFIAKAIRLGVPKVYAIHGVGKGRLKDEIASRLIQNQDVQTFKNDYHPRYGWGSTEIVF